MKNGSYETYKQGFTNLPKNSEIEFTYTYLNGVQTVSANNLSETLTNSSIQERNYIKITANNLIKNIRIHEL